MFLNKILVKIRKASRYQFRMTEQNVITNATTVIIFHSLYQTKRSDGAFHPLFPIAITFPESVDSAYSCI